LLISGQPLRRYTVEVSDDLIQWTPLATTLADAAGTAYFRDKATVPAHREAAGNIGLDQFKSALATRCAGVSSRSALAGAAGPGQSRFYRSSEAP